MSGSEGFDAVLTAKTLVRQGRRAALATLDADSGSPYVSLVATATAMDGAPILLLSTLAKHTRNLAADPRASLLFEDVELDNPLAGARVSISGNVTITQDEQHRARYLARHATHKGFSTFPDFAFYRMDITSAHLVAGFGRIETLEAASVMTDLSGAEALIEAEAGACRHMNEDHADALALYATQLLSQPAGEWRCQGLDPEGLELASGGHARYLRFPERVADSAMLRKMLVSLAEAARSKA